jgi:hypothetical protein
METAERLARKYPEDSLKLEGRNPS